MGKDSFLKAINIFAVIGTFLLLFSLYEIFVLHSKIDIVHIFIFVGMLLFFVFKARTNSEANKNTLNKSLNFFENNRLINLNFLSLSLIYLALASIFVIYRFKVSPNYSEEMETNAIMIFFGGVLLFFIQYHKGIFTLKTKK